MNVGRVYKSSSFAKVAMGGLSVQLCYLKCMSKSLCLSVCLFVCLSPQNCQVSNVGITELRVSTNCQEERET